MAGILSAMMGAVATVLALIFSVAPLQKRCNIKFSGSGFTKAC
jgi:hypothetical protein